MTRLEMRKIRHAKKSFRQDLAGVESFAGKIRKTVLEKGPLRFCEIADYLDLSTPKERSRISATLHDLLKAGHIRRLEKGVYGPPAPGATQPRQEKRNIMWRVLRAKQVVTAADLEEMAEVSQAYALEWLRGLVKLEVVRALENGRYRLVKDTVRMPDLTDNAQKLRALRARQKAAFQAVERAKTAINEAMNLMAGEV